MTIYSFWEKIKLIRKYQIKPYTEQVTTFIGCHLLKTLGCRTLVKSAKKIIYFSTKTYVVGTQKNGLNETVILSTQNIC